MTPRIYLTPIAAIPGVAHVPVATTRRGRGVQPKPAQMDVIAAIRDGKDDSAAIAEHSGRSGDSVRQSLYALERDGVIERAGKRKVSPSHYATIWQLTEAA